ncbi:MAG TPA: LemA family protein [Candidatus Peribacteraceae bacterium]|nr:LemA family protein [Candidatus Peribacteraceae bacterium]
MADSKNRTGLYILIAVIVVIVLIVGWIWSGYNRLVTEKANVDNTWRQVETQYQRRADLIPNLVQTVKGASNFEQSTLTAVTNARTQWLNASGNRSAEVSAAQNMDSALSRLLVTVESYPQLQATQAYRDLMTQLEGTENRIAVARKDYNDEVRNYNVLVQTFPTNILAGQFGYTVEKGFESAPGTENAPTVNFGQ